ncbi:MAG TPA: penicillin-binding protein 2 [Candidatus Saccharimonadales bacterium]|nr:penicillin-binding protein 2 [Candidatus Saccharimonadales bacterium]
MSWRYRTVLLFLLVSLLAITARLFYWQVVKAQELSDLGQSQYGSLIKVPATRGVIKTNDNFPIAANKIAYLVFANPKEIKNKNEVTTLLSPILEQDSASISASLSLKDRFWVPLGQIDAQKKDQIKTFNLAGIGFEQQQTRFYPEASMAAHLLGFVGKNQNGDDQGYFGIEGYYDRLLRGKGGYALQIHDAFGKPILAKASETVGQVEGSSLVLSVDRSIQYIAEKKLTDGVEKFGARAGMVAIMDPKTGNILALSAVPSFDPATYQKYDGSLYKNPFITNLYEPGSTFKPLVMSAALDAHLIKPDTKCPVCAGPVSVGGYDLHTWNDKYYKDTTMTDVIIHSDNTGMVFVAEKLGLDRMLEALSKFGIGQTTGIDLQGEVTNQLKPKDQWYAVDLATTGFGQGISVTAMQMLDAFSAIANEGKRMEPHVATKVITANGEEVSIAPKVLDQPISAATAKVMTEIMVNAVNKGEAQFARLKGYRIAGKTGTASIPVAGHYDPTKTIASFVGFGPADDPKFLMLVVIDRPTSSIYGAETAAPVFFDIAKDILNYYNIPPTE